jgi:hypothetical protein
LSGHRALQSPVLVGRDDLLALALRRLAATADGRGHLLFLAGEAGIGKTRLLAAIAAEAAGRSFLTVRAAFPGDAEASGGLLLDLASDLRQSREAGLAEAGEAMAGRLREHAEVGGDRHRQRRLLVQDLTDTVGRLGEDRAALVVLEDLHWADQLSLEVVAHLATRVADRTMLVAGAYRSDELYPRLPMREWRARLLTQRLAEEVRLPRLRRAETATLTAALLGRAPSAAIAAAVHDRSDGIPLHVEELLAAVPDDAATEGPGPGGIAGLPVPDTLADAVLARAEGLGATPAPGAGTWSSRAPRPASTSATPSSATCSTTTSPCRNGADCMSGWRAWPPGAATATPSSRPTSTRPGWPSRPTVTRWRRSARRRRCRPTGRR